MATISLEMAKNELARDILGLTDIDTVMKLRRSYRRITQKSEPKWPWIGPRDVEEANQRIDISLAQALNGESMPIEDFIAELKQGL